MLIMSRPIAIRTGFAAAVGLATVLALSTISSSFGAPPKPPQAANSAKAWVMPDVSTIPAGPLGDTIRLGMNVFNDTPKYA
jgi:hypothetical protein